jgi:hypothetical protein
MGKHSKQRKEPEQKHKDVYRNSRSAASLRSETQVKPDLKGPCL